MISRARPGGSAEQLAKTLRDGLADLPITADSTPLAFVTNAVRFVDDWLAQRKGHDLHETPDTVFVFSERPRLDAEPRNYSRIRHFSQDPRQEIAGQIFLCAANTREVYFTPFAGRTIPHVVQEIINLGFGDRPTVIFSPSIERVTVFAAGVWDEDAAAQFTFSKQPIDVSIETVDDFLKRFHDIYLRTPQRYKRFWTDPDKYVPVPRAEKEIQYCMVPMAMLSFRESIVRFEEEMIDGRADVTIMPDPNATLSGSAVLELKALRSRYPSSKGKTPRTCPASENDKAVVDGIDQARAYRDERRCEFAFLCCYDFRDVDDPKYLDRFSEIAASANVEQRRYRVYNEAAASRRGSEGSAYRTARKRGVIK